MLVVSNNDRQPLYCFPFYNGQTNGAPSPKIPGSRQTFGNARLHHLPFRSRCTITVRTRARNRDRHTCFEKRTDANPARENAGRELWPQRFRCSEVRKKHTHTVEEWRSILLCQTSAIRSISDCVAANTCNRHRDIVTKHYPISCVWSEIRLGIVRPDDKKENIYFLFFLPCVRLSASKLYDNGFDNKENSYAVTAKRWGDKH